MDEAKSKDARWFWLIKMVLAQYFCRKAANRHSTAQHNIWLLIVPGGLRLVVSHLFAVVRVGVGSINLDVRNTFAGSKNTEGCWKCFKIAYLVWLISTLVAEYLFYF